MLSWFVWRVCNLLHKNLYWNIEYVIKRTNPIFSPRFWNVCTNVVEWLPRTKNAVESRHWTLNQRSLFLMQTWLTFAMFFSVKKKMLKLEFCNIGGKYYWKQKRLNYEFILIHCWKMLSFIKWESFLQC